MPLHMQAWEHALLQFGAVYDHEFFFSRKGMREVEIVELYNAHFNTSLDVSNVADAKHDFFRQHMNQLQPITPVVDTVHRYNGILPMAVASGGIREIIVEELRVIGVLKNFDIILTGDDPFKPKPAPDLFLEAARRIDVHPSMCQVFEDGDYGLTAAVHAGMLATDIRPFVVQ